MTERDYSGLPIIMLSMSRWDGPFSSASISLAKEFSKTNSVFYVDNPFTIKDFISQFNSITIQSRIKSLLFGKDIFKQIKNNNSNLIAVTPKLVFPINWMKEGHVYDFFAKINNKVIIEVIEKIKKEYQIKDYILFNSFNPFYGQDIPTPLKPVLSVYQSRDDISESEYVNKHGVKKEIEAIQNAKFSMATSLGLVNKLVRLSNKKIDYLPNAAEIRLFKKALGPLEMPKELLGINKKIIGYTGNICHRINYGLLKKLAVTHHDKVLLLVGPINNRQFYEYGLDKLPNVLTTGAKSIDELPAFLRYMDCAIIPFHCNELTKSIYPLKINEYLAAGKAVVSTNFSEDMSSFKDVVYIVDSEEKFINLIDTAILDREDDQKKDRIGIAESNSWEARVKLFWELTKNNVQ